MPNSHSLGVNCSRVTGNPEPSICVLAPCAGLPMKQPTAVFSAPIWLRVFVESRV